jgi:O-antigen ligase
MLLVVCLPLLVPFPDSRNTDLQGIILLIAGLASWLVVLFRRPAIPRLDRRAQSLLAICLSFCVISLCVNPHKMYDLLGAPYVRLGSLALCACIGCGLALRSLSSKQLITWLYGLICVIAAVSVPYTWLRLHTFSRIGGVFAQADIFAVFMGCGILLGWTISDMYPRFRWQVRGMQLVFFSLLIISETRAVLGVVVLISTYVLWQRRQRYTGMATWKWIVLGVSLLCLLGCFKVLVPSRVTSLAYGLQSVRYRLSLQGSGLRASEQKPLFGYGPGNLADALACNKLTAPSLQRTCHQDYFFNSSHDIFLDGILGIGWIGGSAILLLVLIELKVGLKADKYTRTLAYCILLIACYYLTNVTNISLELLLWILLLSVASSRVNPPAKLAE